MFSIHFNSNMHGRKSLSVKEGDEETPQRAEAHQQRERGPIGRDSTVTCGGVTPCEGKQ